MVGHLQDTLLSIIFCSRFFLDGILFSDTSLKRNVEEEPLYDSVASDDDYAVAEDLVGNKFVSNDEYYFRNLINFKNISWKIWRAFWEFWKTVSKTPIRMSRHYLRVSGQSVWLLT